MRHESHIAPPADPVPGRGARRPVGQRHPVDGEFAHSRVGQERRLEGQNRLTGGARRLREDQDPLTPRERLEHPAADCQHGSLGGPVHEYRASQRCQRPKEGPAPEIGPCHEDSRGNRVHYRNVDVAQVVGDDDRPARGRPALDLHSDARCEQEAPPPDPLGEATSASPLRGPRPSEEDRGRPARDHEGGDRGRPGKPRARTGGHAEPSRQTAGVRLGHRQGQRYSNAVGGLSSGCLTPESPSSQGSRVREQESGLSAQSGIGYLVTNRFPVRAPLHFL